MSTTPRPLTVALVQAGQMTSDIEDNLARLEQWIRAAAEGDVAPDLIVLPELITTPYFCTSHEFDRSNWAATIPGPTTDRFGSLAKELGCAIAFGMYERTAHDVFHNSVVVVDAGGEIVPWATAEGGPVAAYRKLSIPANWVGDVDIDEKYFFAPGQAPVVLDILGTRIGCVICYDRSFPEYWAVARAMGAEVVLAVVSSLGTREDLFVAELQTRAMESQTWVLATNRGGVEELDGTTVSYFGRSSVIDPTGKVVADARPHATGDIVRFTIDLAAVTATRAAFPLGRDRRADVMSLLARLTAGTEAVQPRPGASVAP